jgi:beta-lysine 5,6-aminomutase alpha subunit
MLAGTWGARASVSTTVGRERAILRLFGVHGLDRGGRPLAGEVVDRYVAGRAARLATGIAIPFAMALVEYDLTVQEIALDVASGAIDLALEAELLARLEQRAAAEQAATRLAASALERIDANRTARAELLSVLGDPPRPWVGASLTDQTIDGARDEVARLVAAGADVVRASVPAGRELTDRLFDAGVAAAAWRPRGLGNTEAEQDTTPSGSQRGLAELRERVDEAAAERGSYVRLATSAPPLAAPEQAVVAAFERLDVVEVDPLAEIVDASVDPDRALADHAFADWLHRRSGSLVVVGPGPLVVAPDMRRGIPSDPATRAGRALALQLVAVGLARHQGLAPGQIVVGALPSWLAEEREPVAHALAQVSLRRALFPEHQLAFEEPAVLPPGSATPAAAAWPFVLATVLASAGPTALVVRRSRGEMAATIAATRAAAAVAQEAAASLGPWDLHGPAREAADAIVAGAIETLTRLADEGWDAILGEPIGGPHRARLGADAVVERTEAFDPFEAADLTSGA